MQYLAEATVANMFAANFAPVVEQNLLRIAPDVIASEQHMDMLRNRAFRQTLLCHRDVRLVRQISGANLDGMFFAGQLAAVDDPTNGAAATESSHGPRVFRSIGGDPRGICALESLVAARRLARRDAGRCAKRRPKCLRPTSGGQLSEDLVQCVARGLVRLQAARDAFVGTVSARPAASPLARLQAGLARM